MTATSSFAGTPDPASGGWLRRTLRAVFSTGQGQVSDVPLASVTRRHRLPRPMLALGRGFVFPFRVFVWFTWRGEHLSESAVDYWANSLGATVRADVAREVADLARSFHPHQASELEINLNRRLATASRTFQRSGGRLTVTTEVRVRLDEEVREQLRPSLLEQLRMETEHDLKMRRAQMVETLTQRWADVIGRLRPTPFGTPAAKLSDATLAMILDELVNKEQTSVEELAHRLYDVIRQSHRVGQPLDQREADEFIALLNDALGVKAEGTGESSNGSRPKE